MSPSAEPVTIHATTPDDTATIAAFIRELAEYERRAHEVVFTEEGLREALFGPQPGAEVLLAKVGEDAVGFALFFPSFSSFLGQPGIYLEDVFVRPSERGRGIGRLLLKHVAKLAIERGGGRLEWSVLDSNEPAIQFYERLEARPLSEWTTYRLSSDALKRLSEVG